MSEETTNGKTYGDLIAFINAANMYLEPRRNGAEPPKPPKETKFTYALRKVAKKVQKKYDDGYAEPLEDERVKLCLTAPETTDKVEKGEVLRDERGMMRFSRENMQALTTKQRELFKKTVEIEPHFVAAEHVPTDLSAVQRNAFADFVIKDEEPTE